ncbi:hypothetical protein K474DRAFT_1768178 [Panus rudis PR-1116 ss-1]|nr:hypothetical protein K474DRAFT_1768178 [Panus rudis PR-1116 ss-1]
MVVLLLTHFSLNCQARTKERSDPRGVPKMDLSTDVVPQTDNTPRDVEARPRVTIQSLPLELLLEIFRYATFVPGSRDLTPLDPFAPAVPSSFALAVNSPVLAMRTKCTLVGVCKEWRQISLEVLFEHVLVTGPRKAGLVLSALELPCLEQGDQVGNGRWVRHIEVNASTRDACGVAFLSIIAKIISRCPNLRTLSGFWRDYPPKEFLDFIVQHRGISIEGLAWGQPFYTLKSQKTGLRSTVLNPGFLDRLGNLRVLDLGIYPRCYPHNEVGSASDAVVDTQSSPSMCLPSLSTLIITPHPTSLLTFMSTVELPALRKVIINSAYTDYTQPRKDRNTLALTRAVLRFLRVHGPSIIALELVPPAIDYSTSFESLSQLHSSTLNPASPFPISPGLFLQPGLCPNLQDLVYSRRERPMVYPVSLRMKRKNEYFVLKAPTPLADPRDPEDGVYINAPPASATTLPEGELPLRIPPDPTMVTSPHPSLRRIAIRDVSVDRLYPSKPCRSQCHLLALLSLKSENPDLLPALTVVRTTGLVWESSLNGEAAHLFIFWTERFRDLGVSFTDGAGVLWLYEDEIPAVSSDYYNRQSESLTTSSRINNNGKRKGFPWGGSRKRQRMGSTDLEDSDD